MSDGTGGAARPAALPGARELRLAGQSLVVVVGAFLAAIAVTAPLSQVALESGLVAAGSPEYRVVQTVLQFAGFLLAVVAYVVIADDRELLAVAGPDRRTAVLVAGGTVLLLGVQFVILWAFSLAGIEPGQNRAMLPGQGAETYFLYMIVVSVLVVGPVEELLFRGVVQGLLRRALGAVAAILAASALFGAVHVFAVAGTPGQQALYATVAMALGCLLGGLYEYTDDLLVPASVHGLYNATLFALQYARIAGPIS